MFLLAFLWQIRQRSHWRFQWHTKRLRSYWLFQWHILRPHRHFQWHIKTLRSYWPFQWLHIEVPLTVSVTYTDGEVVLAVWRTYKDTKSRTNCFGDNGGVAGAGVAVVTEDTCKSLPTSLAVDWIDGQERSHCVQLQTQEMMRNYPGAVGSESLFGVRRYHAHP